jgi:hypothetical protein
MSAQNLSEAMTAIQLQVRGLNDNGRKMDENTIRDLVVTVDALAAVVDALVHGQTVPSTNGEPIR